MLSRIEHKNSFITSGPDEIVRIFDITHHIKATLTYVRIAKILIKMRIRVTYHFGICKIKTRAVKD